MAGNVQWKCLCSFLSIGGFIAGIITLFVAALPVAQITIGAVNVYECPAAPVIPVYVLVCGILALLLMGLIAVPNFLCPLETGNKIWTVLVLSLVLFAFIWFFFGSYQVYSVYPPNYNKNITIHSRVNTSIYPPTAPGNKLGPTLQNQSQSLNQSLNLNQSQSQSLNQSLNLNQSQSQSLNQSLNLNQNQSQSLNQSLNLNQSQSQSQSLPNLNHTQMINNNQTLRKLIQTLASIYISNGTHREHLKAPQGHHVLGVVPYCDRTVYLFAFWTTTLVYILAGNALVMFICLYGFMKITNKMTELLTT
ncbi:uncharacterized protein [Trachinotus anak]|uniref:uncharacterized protein n=1 Tax=Trachinotus anak TaxID=443729 RepID=UPI0039F1C89F